jgi:TPR repeat protein
MGSDIAEYQLGLMYSNGYGVYKDDYVSFSWYLRAAKKLDKNSWFRIAQMFNYGQAIPRNEYIALQWFYRYNKNGVHTRSLERKSLHLTKHDKSKRETRWLVVLIIIII